MRALTKRLTVIVGLGCLLQWTTSVEGAPLIVPDNGTGTADIPHPLAEYISPDEVFIIIDGLPPGTTIELAPVLGGFTSVMESPGGSLGGTSSTFEAVIQWDVTGTGELSGFTRYLTLPLTGQWHMAPRTPGDPVQSFDADVFHMQGELYGNPDFCDLSFLAGTSNGLPSPGRKTLTELPDGDFWVDSFFDVTYQISFAGCPGSILEGMAGITTATIRLQAGETIPEPGADFNGDEHVDDNDLLVWNTYFGLVDPLGRPVQEIGDADEDCDIDGNDFLIWQRAVSSPLVASASSVNVPEPSSWLLVTVSLALCLTVRIFSSGNEANRPIRRANQTLTIGKRALDL